MTTEVDIANLAFQAIGTRTTIASLTENSNSAIQANLAFTNTRDALLRMAQWNCATNWANATLISAVPGTPENTTAGTALWAKGLPAPPWVYEYQYPVDCLRPLWIVPQFTTGFSGGVPITTAVTGGAAAFWNGPPVRFKVGIDQFIPVTGATVAAGGTGHAVGDIITLASGAVSSNPIGAPARLLVLTAPAGVIGTVSVVAQVLGSSPAQGGSYFARQTNPVAQGSTSGSGSGATFTLTYGTQASQRVILTNQESALLCYIKQITDPNLMDPEFVKAWSHVLGATISFQLTGDGAVANRAIAVANDLISQARAADGNEGLTINDVVPDWIRIRGIDYTGASGFSPNLGYDWGGLWPVY